MKDFIETYIYANLDCGATFTLINCRLFAQRPRKYRKGKRLEELENLIQQLKQLGHYARGKFYGDSLLKADTVIGHKEEFHSILCKLIFAFNKRPKW